MKRSQLLIALCALGCASPESTKWPQEPNSSAFDAVVDMPTVGAVTFRRSTPGAPLTQSEIWMMNGDGSNPTRVTCNDRDDQGPAWSPNGQQIAFYSQQVVGGLPTQFLYLIDVRDGCAPGTLLAEGRFPRWSPDGKKIVFDRGRLGVRDLFVRNLADGTEVNLTNDATARNLRGDWSPDGKTIVFARGAGEDAEDIYMINADGSDMTQLTFNPAGDNAPKWSPDGKHIVFQSDRDGHDEIYVMDADGSNQTRLTFRMGRAPEWSPDGRKIMFHSETTGSSFQLFVMDADGSGVTQVTDLPTSSLFPAWRGGRVKRPE